MAPSLSLSLFFFQEFLFKRKYIFLHHLFGSNDIIRGALGDEINFHAYIHKI